MPTIRPVLLWVHRWVGLVAACFLIVEGGTGALLAFYGDLSRLTLPAHFSAPPPSPDARRLSPAELLDAADRALGPKGAIGYFLKNEGGAAVLHVVPRLDPLTGKPFDFDADSLYLDPWTGDELGRLRAGGYTEGFIANIMPVAYQLHVDLMMGGLGGWILGIVALAWTVDCFVSFCLTLPIHAGAFWRRWRPAWWVKWSAGAYRIHLDLHRASGLWLWLLLLVFAWSSVQLDDATGSYEPVMGALFDHHPGSELLQHLFPHEHADHGAPVLDRHAAQAAAQRAVAQLAREEGFTPGAPVMLNYFPYAGRYDYAVESDRRFPEDRLVTVFVDSTTGALAAQLHTRTPYSGNTVSNWLRALHMIRDPVDYLAYRVAVCLLGIVIVLLSVTGVYIWWKKHRARRARRALAHRFRPRDPPPSAMTGIEFIE